MNTSFIPKLLSPIARHVILVVLACGITLSTVLPSRADDYYLQPIGDPDIFDTVPVATLTSWAPFAPLLLNYDPGRDSTAGLLIQKGGNNQNETDPVKQQTWVLPGGGFALDGAASMTVWAAMKDFDTSGKRGHMDIYLGQSNPDGSDFIKFNMAEIDTTSWSAGWNQFDLNFGTITETVDAGKVLAVKAIVDNNGDDDMMLAYGTIGNASKVSVTPATTPGDANLQVVMASNRTWAYVGTSIVYTMQYNCVSTIAAGENVTITDTLDPFLKVTGLTNSSHIASSNYDPTSNKVTFTFVDPLPAGSAGEVKITAEFIPGVAHQYAAPNFSYMSASNAANQTSNTVIVLASNSTATGPTYNKGVHVSKSANTNDLDLPYERIYYDISHGNTGAAGEDVENYVLDDIFPTTMKLWRFNVGEFPGTSQTVNVSYQTNSSSSWQVWPSGPWNTDNDDSYVYPTELGLPASDYVSALRFDFGTLPGGGGFHPEASGVEAIDLDLELVDPTAVVIGNMITNCANVVAAAVAGSENYDVDSCDDVVVAAPDPDFYLWDWDWHGAGPYEPGDIPRMGFTLGVEQDNGIPLVNPTIASLLPPGFEYKGDFTIEGDAWTEAVTATGATYVLDVIDNFAGGSRQLVRMTFSNLTIPALGVDKRMWFGFDMTIAPETPYGASQSEVYGSWQSPLNGTGTGWSVTDSLDYDGNGNSLEKVAKDTGWWQVGNPGTGAASIDSVMWVKGELDSTFSKYPDIGLTVPSGQADYELRITNAGSVALKGLTVIEILPHVGDTGVIDLSARGSEWAPFLVAAVAAPAGIDVFYSTSGNPCREELTPGLPAGCDPPAWSATVPADPSTVKSLKFAYQSGRWLMPGEEILISWPMRAAINAPTNGDIAWSSFGVVATRADDGVQMLPSEPMKVGMAIQPPQPPFYGDTVWFDADRDGVQDAGELGLNGVRVELYTDDGDGVADPTVDTMYSFTVTSNDGTDDGKYLFPYLPPGDYFSVFHMPTEHLPSPPNAASGDLDSDGTATMLGSQLVAITKVTNIEAGESDFSWDQGVYDRSALPAVWAIADLGAGSVVIGGKFQSSHGIPCGNIAVLGPNGSPSANFDSGTGFDGIVRALAVTDDGKILVGGEFSSYDGYPANGLALLDGDGGWVSGLAMPDVNDVRWVGASGSTFYIAGGFSSLGGQSAPRIGRLNSDGSVDTSFQTSAGADGAIHCGAVSAGGVIVGGSFSSYDGLPAAGLTRINADGSHDANFNIGSGFDGPVNSITEKGGMIYAVGEFSTCNDHPANGSARLGPGGTVDISYSGDDSLSVSSNRASQ